MIVNVGSESGFQISGIAVGPHLLSTLPPGL